MSRLLIVLEGDMEDLQFIRSRAEGAVMEVVEELHDEGRFSDDVIVSAEYAD